MAPPYSDESRPYPGPSRRVYPPREERDGRMYDDRSRSRSPGGIRSSPHGNDHSGSPPQRTADHRREYSRDRDAGAHYESRERDDYRHRSPPRRGRQGYRDRDREGYRSPDYNHGGSYSRSRSPRRAQSGFGPESREIMMEGFPMDMTEDDIGDELQNAYHVSGLEEIRVIRDRQTKVSRQLGFLRFHSINESRAFLERNHPFIYLYGPSAGDTDRSTKVRIAYSRERDDRSRTKGEGDWTCRMCAVVNFATRSKCFRCNAPRPEILPAGPPGVPIPKAVNNGDNDAAPENQPSQFLLFRGLESSVTEELLAKGVAKLYRPTGGSNDGPSSINQKKGAKVASTTGDANLGAREGSIRRVLLVRDRNTNDSWRFGFAEFANVLDAQAAMARLNSFEKFTISSKPVMVSYIHAGVFVPVMDPKPSTAHFTFSPLSNPSVKLMYWDDEGYVTELMLTSGEEDVAQDQPKSTKSSGQREHNENKGTKEAEKAKKRKADAAANASAKKLAMPSHLQFWSNRHAELHGIAKDGEEDTLDGSTEKGGFSSDTGVPPTQSYADLNRNCCYLCMRQFKSSANVNRHERLSQLHRDNLQNEELKSRGMAKLIKHGIVQQSSSEYRDRARERRRAFGRTKTGARQKPAAPKEEEAPPLQATSKGASLLSKMGWSAGSGLGAQGTGVTAPIATEVYAQGVGLGAQGSKLGDAVEEAGRNTRGRYDEFLEKTRETARQRYDQMNE